MHNKSVIMFAGKGGVGKTTCAAATALHYAMSGSNTLALSTDPTPSLGHIFDLGKCDSLVRITDTLDIDEIGRDQVKSMWDGRFGREVYEVFSSFVDIKYEVFIDYVGTMLPGLRDEFLIDYIRELVISKKYHKLIWDTAPLGQTLGLLDMPTMLGKHLKTAPRIYSSLKLGAESKRSVMDIIKGWEKLSLIDKEFLIDEVSFVIVTIPEALALEQLDDLFAEIESHRFSIGRLVINNVVKDADSPFLMTRAEQQRKYIDMVRAKYSHLEIAELPLFSREIKGIERLKQVAGQLYS